MRETPDEPDPLTKARPWRAFAHLEMEFERALPELWTQIV